jgi:hypothetical protein
LRCVAAQRGDGRTDALLGKAVEVLAALPKVNHAPAIVDRTGRMEQQPVGGVAVRVNVTLNLFECRSCDTSQLDSFPTIPRRGAAERRLPELPV